MMKDETGLLLNHVLNLSQEQIENSKIELNMYDGSDSAKKPFIDKWLSHTDEEKKSGSCGDCSYWGWYGKKRNFSSGEYAFSFVRLDDDEWLFISAARIVDVPANARAKVEILSRFIPLFGRLVIKYKKGNTFSRYVFRMTNLMNCMVVKEILPGLYTGEEFEGYDKVHLPFNKLADILDGKILPTYYEALEKITGIYCLTDKKTGKLYIGSATGEKGVKQRWRSYIDTKDGGNKQLIELRKKEGDKYFEQYFTFTLLEYWGLSYDPDKIRERENYWKDCLDTRGQHGYNDN